MARRYTERKHTLSRLAAAVVPLMVLHIAGPTATFANVAKKQATSTLIAPVSTVTQLSPASTLAPPTRLTICQTEGGNLPYLPSVARETLRRHFGLAHANSTLSEFADSLKVPAQFKKRAGVFVTLSKNGKTRACWGALDATFDDLVKATVYTTERALNDEYRYKKISASEIESLKPQVTVVKRTESLPNLREQNPRTCGMIVRSGGKSGVILPGEYTDAYYQMVQCKLKAGISKNEPCQIYRIRADVYR